MLVLAAGCARQPEPAKEAEKERAGEPAPPPAEPAKEAPAAEPAKSAEPVTEAKKEPVRNVLLNPSSLRERAPETFKALFETSKGSFTVQVTKSWAPRGADRFYNLVKNGFYDEARFFRVVPNFVVQFGLPADPAVSRVWSNATIADDPVKINNAKGFVVFANAGPNTRTTQLFINLRDNSFLDSQGFSPFGEVVEGMNVVESLYSGYGESTTDKQGEITAEGNAYLKRQFPRLDYIKSARIQ